MNSQRLANSKRNQNGSKYKICFLARYQNLQQIRRKETKGDMNCKLQNNCLLVKFQLFGYLQFAIKWTRMID